MVNFPVSIVFVSLYSYQNFPVRFFHSLIQKIPGVEVHSIFIKNLYADGSEGNRFEYPTKQEETIFLDLIKKLNPRIVSFTVLSPFVIVARRLTKLIKQIKPETRVVWGGIHPTLVPEECIKDADIVCIGEGEGALTELVTQIRDGQPYYSINNLWTHAGYHVVKNPLRYLVQDIDALPFPLYGDPNFYFIDNNRVTNTDPLLSEDNYFIQTARGCPWKCSYCVNSVLKPMYRELGAFIRRRSVDSVIQEITEHISLTGGKTKYIFFVDEVFTINAGWIDEFVVRYKKEVVLPFFVFYHPKSLDLETLDKLISAGLDTVSIGIQTGSDKVRNQIYNRPEKNTDIVYLAEEITKRGVKIRYDLILDSPYDTEPELEDTIRLLTRLPKPLQFSVYSLQYFPNYELTLRAIKDGYIMGEDVAWDTEKLLKKSISNWSYTPKLFPYTRITILKNIIWLIVENRVDNDEVILAVFYGDFIRLHYLNFKSVFTGLVFGMSRNKNIRKLLQEKIKEKLL